MLSQRAKSLIGKCLTVTIEFEISYKQTEQATMLYSKDGIPAQVINNIVWSTPNDNIGTDVFLIAEDGVITERRSGGDVRDALSLRQLTTKEVHSFVKVVVTSNKTQVYRHLDNSGFRPLILQ